MTMSGSREYAGFQWRVAACLIDFVIVMSLVGILALIAAIGLAVTIYLLHINHETAGDIGTIIGCTLGFVVTSAYYAGFECSSWQATPGKRIFGMIVTDVKGNRLSFFRALIRFFLKALSGPMMFGLAYLVCLLTERKQTLYDIIVNTLVWKAKKETVDTELVNG